MPPARKPRQSDVYVARDTFACEVDGENLFVHKGETRVRAGHKLLDIYPDAFELVGGAVQFDVEQATDAPGEKRNH